MPPPPNSHVTGPSTIDKLKMGGLMGGTVGIIIGFIYGTVSIFQYGAGANGVMRTLGQYMAMSGATFGFFMSIGSVIRSDATSPIVQEAFAHARQRPWLILADQAYRPRPNEN